MRSQEIVHQLKERHHSFAVFITALDEAAFSHRRQEKWTPGEQLEHILRSIKPLALALLLPKWALRGLFGKANRPSGTYEALVEKYRGKLAAGGRATGRFVPRPVGWAQKDRLARSIERTVDKLAVRLDRFSERELDTLLLPHPLLGKLTLREMMYFTIYHVGHHLEATKRNLSCF